MLFFTKSALDSTHLRSPMKDKIINFIEGLLEKVKRSGYTNDVDYQYLALGKKILKEGVRREGRNGATYSVFHDSMTFDLSKGLPILTTKKIVTRSIIHELIWMLKGDISAKYLKENNVGIWDLWIDKDGNLPNTYPMLWRKYPNPNGGTTDQIATIIEQLKKEPTSRRIILSAWHASLISSAALPPCHNLMQLYVNGNKLSGLLYMRSNDFALGNPFNITQYSLLIYLLAHLSGLEVGNFTYVGGDIHLYENQIQAFKTQFGRRSHPLPILKINPELKKIDDVKFEDFEIIGYQSEAFIKIPVSQ